MTGTLHLYEATDALKIVRDWIDEHQEEIHAAGGELPPALAELLDQVSGEFKDKVERTALFIREMQRTADAAAVESKRLGMLATARKNIADGVTDYLQRQLEAANTPKVVGLLCNVWLQRNSTPSILALPPVEQLPEEYVEHFPAPPPAPNRKTLLNAFAEGKVLPTGVTIEIRKHVRIR